MKTIQYYQSRLIKIYKNDGYIDVKSALFNWRNADSEELRVRLLSKHMDRLYLNEDLRAFLIQFTYGFPNLKERVKILTLLRKIIAQNPKRKIPYNDPWFQAFEEELIEEIGNDIEFDAVVWVDEELKYIAYIEQLAIANKAVTIPQTQDWLNKEKTCERYKISGSTFDRFRKKGFPCQKHGGILLVNKTAADKWIMENLTAKNRFSFTQT